MSYYQFTYTELATSFKCKDYFQVFGKSHSLILPLKALELLLMHYSEYEFGYD